MYPYIATIDLNLIDGEEGVAVKPIQRDGIFRRDRVDCLFRLDTSQKVIIHSPTFLYNMDTGRGEVIEEYHMSTIKQTSWWRDKKMCLIW